jgi:hypothetical protein
MPFRREFVVRSGGPGVEAGSVASLSVRLNVYAPAAPYVSRKPADDRLLALVNATFVHALESGTPYWISVESQNFARASNVI